MLIIIKDRHNLGSSRSEIETNLNKEWGSSRLSEEQIDKCKFAERKTSAAFIDTGKIKEIR